MEIHVISFNLDTAPSNKKFRFAAVFADAIKELLESLKPPATGSIHDSDHMDLDQTSEAESEDEVQAVSTTPNHRKPATPIMAEALEEEVPTVKVDNNGHAYLTVHQIVFPKHDEVCFDCMGGMFS